MPLIIDDLSNCVNHIVYSEGLGLDRTISINNQSYHYGFKYNKKQNTIYIGQVSLTFAILNVAYCLYPKLYQRLLFLYTLVCDNLANSRLNSYTIYLEEIEKELNKRHKKLRGTANSIFINEIVAFLIGHETMHACFRFNEEYKQKITSSLAQPLLNDIPEGRNWIEKYSFSLLPKAMTDKQKEECACDQISLKYLFAEYVKKDISGEQLNDLVQQILYSIMMQKYSANLDIMRNFSLSNGSIRKHNNLQTAIMFRMTHAAMVLQDFLPDNDIDLNKLCKSINRFSFKLMNGIVFKNSYRSIISVLPNEKPNLDNEVMRNAREVFTGLTNDIQNLVLDK